MHLENGSINLGILFYVVRLKDETNYNKQTMKMTAGFVIIPRSIVADLRTKRVR